MLRVAGSVLGVAGGLAAGTLGAKWLVEAGDLAAARALGVDTGEIDRLVVAAYFLLAALVLGVAGGVLALRGRGKPAGGLMIIAATAPAVAAPAALACTWILLVGAVLAWGADRGSRRRGIP